MEGNRQTVVAVVASLEGGKGGESRGKLKENIGKREENGGNSGGLEGGRGGGGIKDLRRPLAFHGIRFAQPRTPLPLHCQRQGQKRCMHLRQQQEQ